MCVWVIDETNELSFKDIGIIRAKNRLHLKFFFWNICAVHLIDFDKTW